MHETLKDQLDQYRFDKRSARVKELLEEMGDD